MNFSAELLRFGDRQFYKDWWYAPRVCGCVCVVYEFYVVLVELGGRECLGLCSLELVDAWMYMRTCKWKFKKGTCLLALVKLYFSTLENR